MKRIFTFIIIAGSLFVISSCDYFKATRLQAKFGVAINPQQDSIFQARGQLVFKPPDFNEVSRLFYLSKVWGFVKYYHENDLSTKPIDVDLILLKAIPEIIEVADKAEFNEKLMDIINSIQVSPLTGRNPYPDIEDYCLINNEWMKDTICINDNVARRLEEIFLGHSGTVTYFAFNRGNIGTIRHKNERDYTTFDEERIRLLGLFRYWNMINYFYPSKNYMDESWDMALYESIPLFKDASSKEDYHREIHRLTNRLQDTHASHPKAVDEIVFGPYRPNFRMMKLRNTFVISKIRFPDINPENFKPGDIVLRVDGEDVDNLYDSLQAFTGGGNYWSKQRFVCNAVLSRHDSITAFTILRGSDTLIIYSINRKAWDMSQQKLSIEQENENSELYCWVNDSLAYLDMTSATPKNLRKNFSHIKHAKSIIINLRCYPHPHLIENLADHFVPPKSLFAYATYADARFPGMLRQNRASNYIGKKNYYKGKVIVLVNELTESYSEYLTMLLQANPNTITVGRSSSGADGNVSILEFPGRVKTVYSGIGIYYPGMIKTQRVGVKVDYITEPTVESLKNGIDVALEKAVDLTLQQKHRDNLN